MAIVFREPNQVKWIGVRPGHNGEQILENDTAINVLTSIYVVPADKLLLLFAYDVSVYSGVAATGYFYIYDDTPAIFKSLAVRSVAAAGTDSSCQGLWVPIEIPAAYSLRIITSNAGCSIRVCIHGILIDA